MYYPPRSSFHRRGSMARSSAPAITKPDAWIDFKEPVAPPKAAKPDIVIPHNGAGDRLLSRTADEVAELIAVRAFSAVAAQRLKGERGRRQSSEPTGVLVRSANGASLYAEVVCEIVGEEFISLRLVLDLQDKLGFCFSSNTIPLGAAPLAGFCPDAISGILKAGTDGYRRIREGVRRIVHGASSFT